MIEVKRGDTLSEIAARYGLSCSIKRTQWTGNERDSFRPKARGPVSSR